MFPVKSIFAALALAVAAPLTFASSAYAQGTTVIVIDRTQILTQSKAGQDVRTKIQGIEQAMQAELQPSATQLQTEGDAIEAKTANMTPEAMRADAALKTEVENYARKANDFNRRRQIAAQELALTERKALIDLNNALVPVLREVVAENSANIILDDVDFASTITRDVFQMCTNSGQSCNAPTRMLVPSVRMDEAAEIAKSAAENVKVGDPNAPDTTIGPVVSEVQFNRIQGLIEKGIEEGARLECGGPGRPDGLNAGYYVRPTVFSHVTNDMTIAREEIFGPVLSLIGYEDDDDAVRIANDTSYGLSGYVSGTGERARDVARRIRTGNVHLNGAPVDNKAPFGGYKQSGNGREWGRYGFEEFLEVKAIMGYNS